MTVSMCSAVKCFRYLHHQNIAVSSEDWHKSIMRSSLLKISMHEYCDSKCTGLTRRDHQNKYMGSTWESQFVTCGNFEVCFLNCLIIFHRMGKDLQFPHFWEAASEGLSTWPGTHSKEADCQKRLNDRGTVSPPSGSICTNTLSSAGAQACPSLIHCNHSYTYIFSTVSNTGITQSIYDSSKQVLSMYFQKAAWMSCRVSKATFTSIDVNSGDKIHLNFCFIPSRYS